MWPALIAAGASFLGSLGSNAKNERANAAAAKKEQFYDDLRVQNNVREGAVANLQRYIKSGQNKAIMEAAGSTYTSAVSGIQQALGNQRANKFERELQAAEQAGALLANFASTGNTGESLAQIEDTMRLAENRQLQSTTAAEKYQNVQMVREAAGIMTKAAASLDTGTVYGNMDYTLGTVPRFETQGIGSMLLQAGAVGAASMSSKDWADAGQMFGGASASSTAVEGTSFFTPDRQSLIE